MAASQCAIVEDLCLNGQGPSRPRFQVAIILLDEIKHSLRATRTQPDLSGFISGEIKTNWLS